MEPLQSPRSTPSDVAFTDAVKAHQTRRGSRKAYARVEWSDSIPDSLAAFIGEQTSMFLATANADGQPYIQHRGGPPGFLHVLDAHTIGFADYRGNKQYISLGNLDENPKAHLFLIDFATRRRIKIWGEARVVEDDPALLARLMPDGYDARPERAFLIHVVAWDENCPQHIPQRFDAADVERAIAVRDARIAELTTKLADAEARAAVMR